MIGCEERGGWGKTDAFRGTGGEIGEQIATWKT
jgi:hypothetical protein